MELEILGIPENKITQLKKGGFESIEQLAAFYPKRYNDFRAITKIDDLTAHNNEIVSVIGEIVSVRNNSKTTVARVRDGSQKILNVVWFNQRYLIRSLSPGRIYVFCGKVVRNDNYESFSMMAPIFFSDEPTMFKRIAPVYPKIKGMSSEYLEKCITAACSFVIADNEDSHEYMDFGVLERLGIPEYKKFLTMVHTPRSEEDILLSRQRIIADVLFPFAMKLGEKKYEFVSKSKCKMYSLTVMDKFIASLPFPLTEDQDKTIRELAENMQNGKHVDALVQGDVGCGKTVIATALAVAAAENGYQVAIMCPTAVLAEQHYNSLSAQLTSLGIKVGLLVSGMPVRQRRTLLEGVASGEIQILIGTHAVISKEVMFKNLALTIVDEEHRFGVEQRDLLCEKSKAGVHNISMSATPIPRSLANIAYGENTTIYNIHTMPAGRKPVQTIVYSNEEKVYASMYNQIKNGHQCYVVCPLIEESDKDALAGVESADKTYKKITEWFSQYPEVRVLMINGNMKPTQIRENIAEFESGKANILVSTTIVEVGVNVPNATVMVIKNAERFGLAQLHQLRGRVGRGSEQAYCVLLSNQKNNPRLTAMANTNDGFEIAQKDLELRGTGDIVGTKQSGIDKAITLMLQNPELYAKITKEVDAIYEEKRKLEKYAAKIKKE